MALVHFNEREGDGRVNPRSFCCDPAANAARAQRRSASPHPEDEVQGGNWPEYEAGLRRRGSLTLWITDKAPDHWQTCGPGGRVLYSDVANQMSLTLGSAFKMRLRQTEGLIASAITLMALAISPPDHTTVNRRPVTAGFRVQNAAASDRKPDCVCHCADGFGDFNA
jgi:hypothetical protein